ncbi:TPA: hypothetical protein NBP20_000639 [Enterobacter hormaechei]|nr:hypothetical protein [Enterobacter hormaechei]HCD6699801.1 hypothetical protein [Enterobacter hormaechei]HCD9313057.1 hypothetical protein [Enterobacter hormaechei]
MSTITKEFTKEQLQQIEAAAKEVMWPVVWSEKKAREHFSEKITPKVVLKLARIALASLEAEPAIHRWRRVTVEPYGPYPWHYGNFIGFSQPVDGIEDEYFYSAPPAPVAVPDESAIFDAAIDICRKSDAIDEHAWNHGVLAVMSAFSDCRAALLQGADGNSPAIPDGWTGSDEANAALIMLDRIETVGSVDDDRIEGIKRIIRALATAPKQEVK